MEYPLLMMMEMMKMMKRLLRASRNPSRDTAVEHGTMECVEDGRCPCYASTVSILPARFNSPNLLRKRLNTNRRLLPWLGSES